MILRRTSTLALAIAVFAQAPALSASPSPAPIPTGRPGQRPAGDALRPTGGPLDLRLPHRAILGDHDALAVTLRAVDPDAIRLVASVGALDDIEVVDGRLQATYRPPTERFPQRAIIAALGPDGLLDWGVIPLVGQPTVETDTTPGAAVTVEVAGERFGPTVADAEGRANLTVLVPPGVAEATVHAVDPDGASTTEPLDLSTPQPPALAAICDADTFVLIALDARGEPLAGAPALSADGGQLGSPRTEPPGVHRASYQLPEGASRARFAIVAEHAGHQASCQVERDAESPPTSEVTSPASRRWLGLGLQGGVHTNFGSIVAPLVTAQLTARLPVLSDGLLVGIGGGFMMQQSEGADRLQGEQVAMTLVGGPLTARVAYELPVPTVTPYVVAQGGVFLMTSRLSSPTAGAMAITEAIPAVGGGLGAWTSLGPGQVIVEAGYTYAELDNALVDGMLGGLGVTGGYRVEL